jgi:hypothetical protein
VSEAERFENDFDFTSECDRLLHAFGFVAQIRLQEILDAIRRADTVGPVLDPTAYQKALQSGSMHAMGEFATKLQPAVAYFREEIVPRMKERS